MGRAARRSAPCRPREEPARLAGRGNMARPLASSGSQAPDPDQREANVVTRVSQWADSHLRLVQVPRATRRGGLA